MFGKKVYHYKVYGINIDSEIEIQEFQIRDNKHRVDVILKIGPMDEKIKREISEGRNISVTRESIWFNIDRVATYLISNGDTVTIDPVDKYDENLLRIYIMGSVLGFLLLQKEVLAIHGGTTIINGNAVIFTGERGAGKSTLTTALGERGYEFLSDDVAAIKINQVPQVNPGFPYHKLCEDAVEKMNYDKAKLSFFKGDGKVKYLIPAFESFCEKETPLKSLFQISEGDVDSVKLEEVFGQKKFHMILNNIYRNEYLSKLGDITPKYFKQCMEVAKNIRCYSLVRPRERYTVDEQITLIEKVLLRN